MFLCIVLFFGSIFFFFFNDTATTEIYTLSLHDALPIWRQPGSELHAHFDAVEPAVENRSEEHTSELQSPKELVCRLLLEKKKKEVTRDEEDMTRIRNYAWMLLQRYE